MKTKSGTLKRRLNCDALVAAIGRVHQQAQAGAAGAVNRHLVLRNWVIGAHIVEYEQNGADRAKYGERLLLRIAADLTSRSIEGLGVSMLKNCRQFFRFYPQIRQPAVGELPAISHLMRDPYILEFAGLAEKPRYTENELEGALLDHIQSFLIELGAGFCFEARQKRVTLDNEHDYLDLVFYHRILRCHLLIDLKVRKFRHADAGQMNFYLNYWKANMMAEGDNPPVGLLLCSDKDETKVEYATGGLSHKLFVSRYLVALPKPEELERLIEADRAAWEQRRTTERRSKRNAIQNVS